MSRLRPIALLQTLPPPLLPLRLLALLPTTIDFLLPRVGLPQLSNFPRMLLALPGGLVLAGHHRRTM